MKHTAVILLVIANLGTTLTTPLVYLDYEIRKDYISRVLCIERDNPIPVCNGKCYLYLQLEESQPSSEDKTVPSPRAVTLVPGALVTLSIADKRRWYTADAPYTDIPSQYSFLNLSSILQPPQYLG